MRRRPATRAATLVDWYGMVEQALRDVAAWAEDGVPAPASTRYAIEDAQIEVSPFALVRRRHPADRRHRVARRRRDQGEGRASRCCLAAAAHTPPGGGKIIAAEWDFEGDGEYVAGKVTPQKIAAIGTTHTLHRAGHVLREPVESPPSATANVDAEYALLQNIDRVRVVVTK